MEKKIQTLTVHNGVTLDGATRNSFTAVNQKPEGTVHLKAAIWEEYGVLLIGFKSTVFVPFTNIPYVTLVHEVPVVPVVKKA